MQASTSRLPRTVTTKKARMAHAMSDKIRRKKTGSITAVRDYQAFYGSLPPEPEKKSFDLIRDTDPEYMLGLWQSETKAVIDAVTLKSLFYSEDWVYITVDRIASKVSSQWVRVMREEVVDGKKVVKPDEAHPVQRLLESPNRFQDYHSWMYSMVADLCLLGNAVIYYAPASNQMVPVPAERVVLRFDSSGQPEAYEVTTITQDAQPLIQKGMKIPVDQVCHLKRPNPSSLMWGLSPFLAGRPSLLFSRYSKEWLNNFYIKGAQPGLVLEMTEEANDKALLRLLKSFESAYHGRRGQRRTLVLPKGIKANPITHSLADQQLKDYVAQNRETILALLGVPKHAVSLAESGSLGSEEYKQAMKDFWAGPIKSFMRIIAGTLTRHLQKELGEGRFLEFDLSDVDILQEDQGTKADLAEKLMTTHTLNEVRKLVYDLPPLPDGDRTPGVSQIPSFDLPPPPAPVQQLSAEPEMTLAAQTTEARPNEKMAAFHAILKANPRWWRRRTDILSSKAKPAQEKMAGVMEAIFKKKLDLTLSALEKSKKKGFFQKADDKPISMTQFKKNIQAAFDGLTDQYIEDTQGELLEIVRAGYTAQLTLPVNMPNLDRINALRVRNEESRRQILEARGLDSFKSISQTSVEGVMARTENVMAQIESGVSGNQTIQEIADTITDYFSEVGKSRAMMIARTEVLTAASLGEAAAMEDAAEAIGDSDELLKVWINASDDRVRGNPGGRYADSESDHWHVAQEDPIPYDQKFSNGLMFPRDPDGDPSNTIQCRCTFITYPKSQAAALGLDDFTTPDPWTETVR